MTSKTEKIILALILILAAGLMFFALGRDDVIGDEPTNNFRALGLLDFLGTAKQSTPLEWLETSPWWLKLSFHDHPLLAFLTTFLSMKIFGATPFAIRLPFVLAGLISVFLIYLIGKKLFNTTIGLLAALILTLNVLFLWISRTGLQEGLVIVLSLAALYFSLKIKEGKNNFVWAALFLGLAFLTKYTAVFLLPVLFLIIFENRKVLIKSWQLWLGLFLIFLINLPTLIYNFKLYQTFGHFDLQLSYFLGQKVAAWQDLVGKPTGTLSQRFFQIIPNFQLLLSPIFIGVSVLAIFFLIILMTHQKNKNQFKLLVIFASLILLMMLVGPQDRFLTMFIPFLALILGGIFSLALNLPKKSKLIFLVFIFLFFGYELFYSVNTLLLVKKMGQPPWWHSKNIALNRHSWGFNQLNDYLTQEFQGKVAGLRFPFKAINVERYVQKKLDQKTGEELPGLLIYDANIKYGPDVWYLRRREVYEGFPTMNTEIFLETLREKSADYFTQKGFKNFYLIFATENSLLRPPTDRFDSAQKLIQVLKKQNIIPKIIYNLAGEPAFEVYKF